MPVRDKIYKKKSNSKHIGSTRFQKNLSRTDSLKERSYYLSPLKVMTLQNYNIAFSQQKQSF